LHFTSYYTLESCSNRIPGQVCFVGLGYSIGLRKRQDSTAYHGLEPATWGSEGPPHDTMAQHDEHPDIRAFLGWARRNSQYAVLDPNTEERCAFMPLKTVQEYFKQDDGARLNELLVAVFPNRDPPVDSDDIFDNYAQIFCILIETGKGRFIENFSSWNVGDRLLPFDPDDPPPAHFPIDTGDPKFYENFCSKQWKFCAPEFRTPMTNIQFHPQRILPIVSKEKIAGGGNGMLYKIRLHSSYNKLCPPSTVRTHYQKLNFPTVLWS